MLRSTFSSTLKSSSRQFSSTSRALLAKATFIGNVGADIVESEGSTGTKYVKYSIAVPTRKNDPPQWFNITSFAPQQNDFLVNYVKKGTLIYVEADIQTSIFEREDGTRSYNTDYIQRRVDFLKSPRREEGHAEEQ